MYKPPKYAKPAPKRRRRTRRRRNKSRRIFKARRRTYLKPDGMYKEKITLSFNWNYNPWGTDEYGGFESNFGIQWYSNGNPGPGCQYINFTDLGPVNTGSPGWSPPANDQWKTIAGAFKYFKVTGMGYRFMPRTFAAATRADNYLRTVAISTHDPADLTHPSKTPTPAQM